MKSELKPELKSEQTYRPQAWQEPLVILFAGMLFGFGLSLSQMINPDRVLGFLDIFGEWDPTLMFVLGGAVGVTIVSFRFILPRSRPLLANTFYLPQATDIDFPLIAGATLFGIGWGIAGYCPGPGWVSLILKTGNPFLFLIAFFLGSFGYQAMTRKTPPQADPLVAIRVDRPENPESPENPTFSSD